MNNIDSDPISLTAPPADDEIIVVFPDDGLEAAIREALGLEPDVDIYRSDLERLTVLIPGRITDLTGLEYAVNLTELWLGWNGITDLSPLANLTNLTLLHLGGNWRMEGPPWRLRFYRITDISPLANLTNLTWLSLERSHVTDISPLANLTNLMWLCLRESRVSDISPLLINEGLSSGDGINLIGNPLSEASLNIYIPQLEGRGVTLLYEEQVTLPDPKVLFEIPNEIKVSFGLCDMMMMGEPRTYFQIGEWVSLSLRWEQLRAGTHPVFAQGVTFVVTDEAGNIIWSKYLDHPIGGGWSRYPGGGGGIGVGWEQVDADGSPVGTGIFKAGIIFTEPAFDFPEDFSSIISFEIVDGTSVFVHSDQYIGSESLAVVVGDIDGDNDLDVILGGRRNEANKVFRNNGDGTFSYDYTFGTRHVTRQAMEKSLILGDFDGDGDLDLLEGTFYRELRLYENDGTGKFTIVELPSSISVPRYPQFIEAADIDRDGDLDILVILETSIKVYVNNGGWDFTRLHTIPITFTMDLAIGDIDNDGDLDIVGVHRILKNDGFGNFMDTGQRLGFWMGSVILGDIDNDEDLDLIGSKGARNKVYLNDGMGIFTLSYAFGAMRGWTDPVVLGDIDNDGDLDLITGGHRTYVYLNDGQGRFIESEHSLVGTENPVLADIDNDGDLDLITTGWGKNKLYINTILVPARVTLTVTIDPPESGTVSLSPPQPAEGYVAGTEVTLTAIPAEGFTFSHWSGDVIGIDPIVRPTMDRHKSVTAHFTLVPPPRFTLTVTVDPPEGGTVSLSPEQPAEGYEAGTEVTLTATAAPGYTFERWSGDVIGTDPIIMLTMDADKSVTAHFTLVPIEGDVNQDGKVDFSDLAAVASAFNSRPGSPNWNPAADLNNDGIVDIFDLVWVGRNFGRR
ncbi:MAG: Internalin-A [Syntrophomonadaceae bacterium]|nr:Internalin-A [Bacillota bacterium]